MLETAVHEESVAALNHVLVTHPGLKDKLAKAPGYIVFPSVGRAGAVIGGAHGHGEVYEDGKPIGFAMMSQITVGVQLGGQTFTELVVFNNNKALEQLKHAGKVGFSANASAVIVKAAATGTSNTAGAEAMAFSRGGMLLELSMGGSSFQFVPPMSKPEPGKAFVPTRAPRLEPEPREQRSSGGQQTAEPEQSKAAPTQASTPVTALHQAKTAVSAAVGGGERGQAVKAQVLGKLGKVVPIDSEGMGKIKDQAMHLAGEAQNRMSSVQHKAARMRLVARLQGSAIKLLGCVKETYGRASGKAQFVVAGKAQRLEGQALEQANRA